MVGDHRQFTYATNNAQKNSQFLGIKIIDKFKQWDNKKLLHITYNNESHRCNQTIANLADSIFPSEPKTISKNMKTTGHDGIFFVPKSRLDEYMFKYEPQVLRYSKSTECYGYEALNFGESKGLTFERVIIFPHKKAQSWIKSGNNTHISGSASKMYVGVTRARFSVAFLFDGTFELNGTVNW